MSFIETNALYALLQELEAAECAAKKGQPGLVILDFRNEVTDSSEEPLQDIATKCPILHFQLDDILNPEVRAAIPKNGRVITITETGNRDEFIIRYLSQHGYTNIEGLRFGMRGWRKARHPTK